MTIKWWEKTVEYYFVKHFVNINKFIAPLDGREEQAGDAIFANENKWILIEFKKDEKSISSEKDKFIDYEEAKTELLNEDGHHFIIYGYENEENKLSLKSQTYFSEEKYTILYSLQRGIEIDDFKIYLEKLLEYKKGSEIEGGTGGYSLIAGISDDGKISKCLTIQEFKNDFSLNMEQKQQQVQRPTYRMRGPGR